MLQYEHLIGRPFVMGKHDCFGLAREFYRLNFDVVVRDYARPQDWSSDNIDLIRMFYDREGFDIIADWKIKDLRPGDVLAMCIGESNPNHIAVMVDDGRILHHLYNRLSNVEELRDFWRTSTAFVLRHPNVPDLRPVYPDVDLGTLLNARYSLQTAPDADKGGNA
jgi:cell wall-associated NlpC family hydrolase